MIEFPLTFEFGLSFDHYIYLKRLNTEIRQLKQCDLDCLHLDLEKSEYTNVTEFEQCALDCLNLDVSGTNTDTMNLIS